MALRRVVLLEGETTKSSFPDDVERLRGALVSKGIGVVDEGGDGLIALPGGVPALDILLNQLDGNDRPCGLLNTSDYYTDLLKTTSDSVVDRFVRESQRGRLIVQRDPQALVQAMVEYLPPETRRQSAANE
jgi:predicted Rossmann-fold nucleotide-binding protein